METKGEILVKATNVSKKFCRNLKTGMRYGVADVSRAMFGIRNDKSTLRKDEFWAVKGINFELRRGECLGLIGRNGTGKSTLLKILNGLITPDEGSIVMRGRVGALIELGAGFNPMLTGRENIFINGQLLGFTKQEVEEKFDQILKFAEIAEFIDTPVQNYSSGMKVRLGFAIAAQMEPDVLIIDEVLAVGDLGFVLKCFARIDTLMKNTAVIFVSHSMPQISRICSSILMLEKGTAAYQGTDVPAGIDAYYSRFTGSQETKALFDRDQLVALESIGPVSPDRVKDDVLLIDRLDNLAYEITLKVKDSIAAPFMAISIYDTEQREVGVCIADEGLKAEQIKRSADGHNYYSCRFTIERIALSKGTYSLSVAVTEQYRALPLLRVQHAARFQVIARNDIWAPMEFEGKWS